MGSSGHDAAQRIVSGADHFSVLEDFCGAGALREAVRTLAAG
jgi:hypothetical protein